VRSPSSRLIACSGAAGRSPAGQRAPQPARARSRGRRELLAAQPPGLPVEQRRRRVDQDAYEQLEPLPRQFDVEDREHALAIVRRQLLEDAGEQRHDARDAGTMLARQVLLDAIECR
jgi:hypothetical protein